MVWMLIDLAALALIIIGRNTPHAVASALPLIMIAQGAWLMRVANAGMKLKRKLGYVPAAERVKLIPYCIALAIWATIAWGDVGNAIALGFCATCLSIFSKAWIANGDMRPIGGPPFFPNDR